MDDQRAGRFLPLAKAQWPFWVAGGFFTRLGETLLHWLLGVIRDPLWNLAGLVDWSQLTALIFTWGWIVPVAWGLLRIYRALESTEPYSGVQRSREALGALREEGQKAKERLKELKRELDKRADPDKAVATLLQRHLIERYEEVMAATNKAMRVVEPVTAAESHGAQSALWNEWQVYRETLKWIRKSAEIVGGVTFTGDVREGEDRVIRELRSSILRTDMGALRSFIQRESRDVYSLNFRMSPGPPSPEEPRDQEADEGP